MIAQLVLLWLSVLLVWRAARVDHERRQNLEAAWIHRSHLAFIVHKAMADEAAPTAYRGLMAELSRLSFDREVIARARDIVLSEMAKKAVSEEEFAADEEPRASKTKKSRRRRRKERVADPVGEFLDLLDTDYADELSRACREFAYMTLFDDRALGSALRRVGVKQALRSREEFVDAIRAGLIETFVEEEKSRRR